MWSDSLVAHRYTFEAPTKVGANLPNPQFQGGVNESGVLLSLVLLIVAHLISTTENENV